jgi:hypothetical protein
MKATVRDSEALRAVRPEDLAQYLVSHKWHPIQHGSLGAIYTRQFDGFDHELLVPLTRELGDFADRISEILHTLEIVEKRSQVQILSDLACISADVIRIRRAEATDGTILLEDGVSLITAAADMVLAAACTAIVPKVYYPGKKPAAAIDYLRGARLGQSERGSYVLTVISPLPPPNAATLLPGLNDPFERQVTRTLAGALDATVSASEVALRTGSTDSFRESTHQGVSANLLDAVLGLMGSSHHPVGMNFAWSPAHPIIEISDRTITIEPDFVSVIEEASRVLKQNAQLPPVELVGVVIALRRPEGVDQGRATLLAFVDGKPKHVTLELGIDNYDLAIRAHQLHSPVICSGELVRLGRATILTNMTNFRFAPEPDQDVLFS